MRFILFLALVESLASAATAGDLSFTVRDAAGRPLKDAVVTAYPNGRPSSGPISFDWPMRIGQKDIQFDTYVLIVPAGATVSFPNLDKVRHHVYSFSKGNSFQFKLYGREESRAYQFMTVGVAALGCNIHDPMVAFVKVVDTRYAAKTEADGETTLRGVPAGPVTIKVWHPGMIAKTDLVLNLTAQAGPQTQAVTLAVRAGVGDPHLHH